MQEVLKVENSNLFENNEENLYLNPRETESGDNVGLGQNSTSANSSAEIKRLSSELNSRISREMDEMMNSVSVQIQRANNDAISSQVLPQIQNALIAGSAHMMPKGLNVPTERPEYKTEALRNEKSRNNSKCERVRNRLNDEPTDNAYDMYFKPPGQAALILVNMNESYLRSQRLNFSSNYSVE